MQAHQQQIEKARSLYRKALAVDAAHMQSILGLAVLEARSGRPRVALKLYTKGLQLEPDNIQLLHASSQLLHQQGQEGVRIPCTYHLSCTSPSHVGITLSS